MFLDRDETPIQRIVLILGDIHRAEMRPLATWIDQLVSTTARQIFYRMIESIHGTRSQPDDGVDAQEFDSADYESSSNVVNAVREGVLQKEVRQPKRDRLANHEVPDLIVVLQSWSEEYSSQDVNDLFAFAPLARIVVCYGAWCESDGRKFDIWPLAVRVPVGAAPFRILQEWQLIQNPSPRHLIPRSASREEVFAFDQPLQENWLDSKSVVVDSPDPDYQSFLHECLIARGGHVVHHDSNVVIFDADPWGASRASALNAIRGQNPSAMIILLTSLASPETIAEWKSSGVQRVAHKLGFCCESSNSLPSNAIPT